MKQLRIINPENVSEEEIKDYRAREAARAVVFDENGKIALLHVSKENYYKIPGGGVEEKEDKMIALRRECREEIGCDIEVINEIGSVVECRKIFHLQQVSYCYLAKVKGQKGIPSFTEDENNNGFELLWLSYDEALKFLTECKATSIEGSAYIVPRDTTFLKEAKQYLDSVIN
jgi:8-oxo-dGTP pyrophosphatase MutT (NUDIX family)